MSTVMVDTKKREHHGSKLQEHIPYSSSTLQENILHTASKVTHFNLKRNILSDDSELYRGGTESESKRYSSRRDPDVILIGIEKTGTGTLLNYLNHHPSMQMMSVLGTKAIHCYFSSRSRNYREDNIWYRSQLPASNTTGVILDKCLYYLDISDDQVPERIYRFNKSIKFFIMTREPVARTLSWYTQYVIQNTRGKKTLSLEDMVYKNGTDIIDESSRLLGRSCYSKAWLKWLNVFPRDQFHLIDGGTFTKDPYEELRKIEIFLNITSYFKREMFSFNKEKGFYCHVDSKGEDDCMGSGKGRKPIPVSEVLRQKISGYFENCNQQLSKLAGKSFSWIS